MTSLGFVRRRVSRREAIGTAAKVAVGVVAAGIVGGIAGYYARAATAPPSIKTKTVISTQTITQTVTATPTPTRTRTIATVTTPTTITTPATTITATSTLTPTITGPITIYGEKGWYPAEEEAKRWIAAMFKRETGIEVRLTTLTQEDLVKKVVAGATAGVPPDIVTFTTTTQDYRCHYSWKGWLEDLSEFEDLIKELEIPDWLVQPYILADPTRERFILGGIPITTINVPFHYWMDLLEEAGMPTDPDEIPMKFKEFSDFWKEAQDRLWQKKPDYKEKVYGIGWPSMGGIGTLPGDGLGQIAHLMYWHGWRIERDAKGLVKFDTPENREALRKVVKWFAETYQAGYMPKGILEWGSPDNNKAFHARQVISVHNGTMSIALYWYDTDKEKYFKKMRTLTRFPSETGERGMQLWESHAILLFRDAPNKDAAKKFIKWFLQPEILNMYLKAVGGRFFPTSRVVLEMDPFWREGHTDGGKYTDPHLPTVYEMLKKGPNFLVPHNWFPYPWPYIEAYPMQACHKVVTEGWSVDEAVNWAMKEWRNYVKPYEEQILSW